VDDPVDPKTWSEGRKWFISVAATVGGNIIGQEGPNYSLELDFCVVGPLRRVEKYTSDPWIRPRSVNPSCFHVLGRIYPRPHCFRSGTPLLRAVSDH
jgi:hypothetical protein